jgi:DNA-binding transcriptional LysR family regulator
MQQLEILVNLVEEGSFSRAGSRMLLTQPSISKHIKNLETFIDATIIDRSSPGISLTEQGRILYSYAKKILNIRDEMKGKIEAARALSGKKIFIAASTIPAAYILPKIIGGFRTEFPEIHLQIASGDSSEVIEMVLESRAEIGFIGKPVIDRRLSIEPLWDDSIILAGNPSSFRESKPLGQDSLRKLPVIGREKGSGTQAVIDKALESSFPGLNLNVICEMGSSEAVKEAILAGAGVSFISVHAIRRELDSAELIEIPVKGLQIKRTFNMIFRKDFKPLGIHSEFMDFARRK